MAKSRNGTCSLAQKQQAGAQRLRPVCLLLSVVDTVSSAPSAACPASPLLWRPRSPCLSLSLSPFLSVSSWDVTLFLPYLPLHLLLGSFGLSVWGSLLLVTGPTLSFICSLRPCAGLPAPLPSWQWSPAQPERAFPALATPGKVAFPPSRATVVGQCPRPGASPGCPGPSPPH